ncbi:MAG TPA: hypothetical protein VED40_09890 [Azospirillaceae bacterium]|nr:hypothetical protein [Azospirillaceae bacterium]
MSGFKSALLGALIFVAATAPARADDQATANRMFIQAVQAIQRADQTYDRQEQTRLVQEADRLLSDIVAKLPESNLAVQLATNQFIGDFDYNDFKSRVRGLACNDPQSTPCLLHRIEGLMQPVEYPISAPRWDWLSLAVAHHQAGNRDRARQIVAPFLGAWRRGVQVEEAGQDLFLGRTLALTGEVDLALELTRQIPDCSTRIYNLSDAVKALVWRGDTARAAPIAEEAAEYARTRTCAWELGLVAQALLRVGNEGRARTLFLNTVEEQFSRFKDKRGNCCPPELAVAAGDLGEANLALGLLRTVQEESPWTVPAVLGRLAARGEFTLTTTYADQIQDVELRAETYVALLGGALRANNRPQAEQLSAKIDRMMTTKEQRLPLVMVQRARADRLLYKDQRWRAPFIAGLSAAERANAATQRRDVAVPFLAALVEMETGVPMLE